MKWIIQLFLFVTIVLPVQSQFYLCGEIKDQRGKPLEGVKITLQSKGTLPFLSGRKGDFGIPLALNADSITLQLNGYANKVLKVDPRIYQVIILEMLPTTAQRYTQNLASVITNLKPKETAHFSVLGETYSTVVENGFIDVKKYPETGFSLNVDKAAYSNIRRFLSNEMFVPVDAVRTEEMLNYFNFKKEDDDLLSTSFNCRTELSSCPWNNTHKLFFVNIVAPKINLDSIPPSNLVFLIDVSGSMDYPNRLPLLQSAFKLLVSNLREKDTLSIVTYGGNVAIPLQPTGGAEKKKMKDAIDSLTANGDTPGENAIRVAYDLAKKTFSPKGNNRVILATDGDFNVGLSSEKELDDLITRYRQTGIYLTCLGVGMGNYKDSKLETLAKKGNGNFAYIDQIQEAEKVLVKEFTSTLYAVANDASVHIKFNKNTVEQFRLIGFDNKKDAIADTSSVLEGGEVGSGHATMAILEIIPQKSDSLLSGQPFANINISYKKPMELPIWQQNFSINYNPVSIDSVDSVYRFAASIAAFASVLKKSSYTKEFGFEDTYSLAESAIDQTNILQNEFLGLIQKALKVYQPSNKKQRKKAIN